jgi:hypothetical protein
MLPIHQPQIVVLLNQPVYEHSATAKEKLSFFENSKSHTFSSIDKSLSTVFDDIELVSFCVVQIIFLRRSFATIISALRLLFNEFFRIFVMTPTRSSELLNGELIKQYYLA